MRKAINDEGRATLESAREDVRRLLALLCAQEPDADKLKAQWYDAGMAVRRAVLALRQEQPETARVEPS